MAHFLKEQILDQPGYSTDVKLSSDELKFFRDSIEVQWLDTIRDRHPALVSQFADVGLDNYHRLAHLVEHEKLWPKKFRVLPQAVVERIKALEFVSRLKAELGSFSISEVALGNTVCEGHEEVYWRIVRPHTEADVGGLHTDKWFHGTIGGGYGMFPPGTTTVKIWMAIYCEPGRNGLLVVPNSHTKDWRYRNISKGGVFRPLIDEPTEGLGTVLVATEPGTLVIFNEKLLHGGAVNRGDSTRVSVEITMVFANGLN